METSGPIPALAVAPAQVAKLLERPGPFLTVYLTTDAEIENAAQRSEQRWKTLRADLLAEGVPEKLLEPIDPLVSDAHLHGQCLTVVVAADGTRHVEHQPHVPDHDVGRWGPLPVLAPLLEWHQQSVPHIVVLTDRRGADLIGFRREGPDVIREAGGHEDPIARSKPGGWSQRRYQERAENSWDANAKEVAAALTLMVSALEALLVVVAGDVRATQLLRDNLDRDVDELVRVVDGGRSPDGSEDSVASEATRLAATVVAADTRTVLERFREERGRHERAADGPVATIEALNESRVEVLLVPGDIDQPESAWFGPDPLPIALSPETLHEVGVESPQHGPLTDVLIRAALGTGAGVRIVPRASAPENGIGALLRW